MEEIKEKLAKVLENKIKISMIAKFKSVEEYDGKIFKDLFDVEMKNLEILYEKYLIYFNEKPNIKAEININLDVVDILEETIELERFLAKKLGANFGVRQAVIHALSDDERFLHFLTKM
ncbi:MAG: hypothetical protein ABGW92_04410 [Methanocaldococcus sp.]